jgi:hypothetical protein
MLQRLKELNGIGSKNLSPQPPKATITTGKDRVAMHRLPIRIINPKLQDVQQLIKTLFNDKHFRSLQSLASAQSVLKVQATEETFLSEDKEFVFWKSVHEAFMSCPDKVDDNEFTPEELKEIWLRLVDRYISLEECPTDRLVAQENKVDQMSPRHENDGSPSVRKHENYEDVLCLRNYLSKRRSLAEQFMTGQVKATEEQLTKRSRTLSLDLVANDEKVLKDVCNTLNAAMAQTRLLNLKKNLTITQSILKARKEKKSDGILDCLERHRERLIDRIALKEQELSTSSCCSSPINADLTDDMPIQEKEKSRY